MAAQAPGGKPPQGALAIPVEDSLDLHTFAPQDLTPLLEDYLEAAAGRGLRQVRLIHGKGRGIQRELVRRTLAGHPLVLRFADAPPERGGWGATLVWLRL